VDNFFAFFVSFFWTTLDPRNVRAHLQGNHLLGTLSSIWLIMLLEAHDALSSGTFFVLTYVLEVQGELLGIGLFTPIWGVVHLLMTKTPSPSKTSSPPKGHLKALGYALVVGHVVPTLAMMRLQPDGEGVASQQIWVILRLFHPVYVFVAWKFLSGFQGTSGPTNKDEDMMSSKRKFYIFSILASAFFHVTSFGLLFADHLVPGWLHADVTAQLDIKTILVPAPFWLDDVMSYETGVAVFLQWDYLLSSSGIVIWAASLYLEAHSLRKNASARAALETFAQSTLVALLAGPAAAAAFLMLERDAALDAAAGQKVIKQQ
jgi:hypothetical protein